VLEFELAGNKIGRRAYLSVPFALDPRKSVGINLAFLNNCLEKVSLVGQTVDRDKSGKILGTLAGW
jgi:hypothetical protein